MLTQPYPSHPTCLMGKLSDMASVIKIRTAKARHAPRTKIAIPATNGLSETRASKGGRVVVGLGAGDGRGTTKLTGVPIEATGKTRLGSVPQAAARTEFLIESLGSGAELARLLGVNRSQPAQWRSGKESPGPVAAQRLLDLDHVVAKALLIWPPKAAIDWLEGANSYLDGARPIDVLRLRGSADVVRALEVAMA